MRKETETVTSVKNLTLLGGLTAIALSLLPLAVALLTGTTMTSPGRRYIGTGDLAWRYCRSHLRS